MKRASLKGLHDGWRGRSLILVDVRCDRDYARGHIPGAISAPLDSLQACLARVAGPDVPIVVYASGEDDLAMEAAGQLEALEFTDVSVLAAGIAGWAYVGYPVTPPVELGPPIDESSEEVISVRSPLVDRETAYGGAFMHEPDDMPGVAGG